MNPESRTLSARLISTVFFVAILSGSLFAANQSNTKYVVLNVTGHDGKVFHIAKEDKEQDDYRKSLDQEYQKAKQAHQETKKSYQKENPGQKYEKPEPQKPRIKVVKSNIKNYHDARQLALDLDKEQNGSKNGKNGKSTKNGKNGKEAEKNGKN